MSPRTRPVTIEGHGLRPDLPPGWEGRVYLRETPTAHYVGHPANTRAGAVGWSGERPNPVLHLANFALPPGRGDFGTGAVELMGPTHVFVSLFEYGAEEAGTPLFAATTIPRPHAREFAAGALQRRLAGQGGWQRFFTVRGRAFCLYVVIGALHRARELAPQAAEAISALEVAAR